MFKDFTPFIVMAILVLSVLMYDGISNISYLDLDSQEETEENL